MNIISVVTKETLSVRGIEFDGEGNAIFISTHCGVVLKNQGEINGWNLSLKNKD